MNMNTDVYRSIFTSHPHATVLFGLLDGVICDVNDAALALYGYGRDEMIGLSYSALSAGPEARLHRRKDGTTLAVETHRSTLTVAGREVGVSVIRDISSTSAPGAVIANGINDLLAAIVAITDVEPLRKEYEAIRTLSLRAAELARRLLEV